MNEQHLKPDEIAMLERAEKATKGPWSYGNDAVWPDGAGGGNSISEVCEFVSEGTGQFIAAARTDLPTILTRLANERAKLAIAIREIEKAATELRRDLPPQYAGVDREGLPIEVEHSSAEMTCGMVAMGLDAVLAHINELEKQHGKT